MSVLTYDAGALFVLRIIKHLTTNPSDQWVNSYEIEASEPADVAELFTATTAFVAFERKLHLNVVQFDRVTVSTWEDDHIPYDPESFLSRPLDDVGEIDPEAAQIEPIGMAWRVNRQATSGRFGNLFYRGCLLEEDVEAPAGKPVPTDATALSARLGAAVDDSLLDQYFGTGSESGLHIAMISFDGTQIRAVTQFVNGGISLIKSDHQWFNRTTGSPSARAAARADARKGKAK